MHYSIQLSPEMSDYIAATENLIAQLNKSSSKSLVEQARMALSINKFIAWMPDSRMSVFGDELRAGGDNVQALSEDEITFLVSLKLLIPRRDTAAAADSFWFSHPSIGMFVQKVVKGRQAILPIVKCGKVRGVSESELFKKLFGDSNSLSKRKGQKRNRSRGLEDATGTLI